MRVVFFALPALVALSAPAMKVPARYEPQKAAYLKKLRGFLTVVNLTARFAE